MSVLHCDRTCLSFPPDEGVPPGPPPLLLFLHGIGERGDGGDDLPLVARWGLPKLRGRGDRLTPKPFPFLVLAPQCPPEYLWSDAPMLAALESLIDNALHIGAADPARVYVTGFSMGGVGTFALALRRLSTIAAIAPVCGLCPDASALPRLAAVPAWIAYAEDDEVTDLAEGSAEAVRVLAQTGRIVDRPYRLGAAAGDMAHTRTADAAYADADLYRWLLSHHRRSEQALRQTI